MKTEQIECPLCYASSYNLWAHENGFSAVRCRKCELIYVNPRPAANEIKDANRTGVHRGEEALDVNFRRNNRKVKHYSHIARNMFADVAAKGAPVRWLDVGAGYGEFIEALHDVLPLGSKASGLEPMTRKVEEARRRGLDVTEQPLSAMHGKNFDFISLINVFSHIPNFHHFLEEIRKVLSDTGEIFIETGNAAELTTRSDYPDILFLPDHLVFAGEQQLRVFLDAAGFETVAVERQRIDNTRRFAISLVKTVMGRPTRIAFPYRSPFRTLFIRARIRPAER